MLVAHVREVNEIVNARGQILATCASHFGVSMFLNSNEEAMAFADTVRNLTAKIFSTGNTVKVEGKSVIIAPAQRQYGDKEVAEKFCEEFFKRFAVPVISWVESVHYL